MTDSGSNVFHYVDPHEAARGVALTPAESAALEHINARVAARASVEEVIDFVFAGTHAISPCDRIGLALVQDGGRRVVSHYNRANYEPLLLRRGYAEDLHGSSLRIVLEQRRPRIIRDLERYQREHPDSRSARLLVREGVRSSMTCPLIVEGRVVGLLFRSARRAEAYDDRQVVLHQMIAERLGQAVEKTLQIERLAAANRDYFGMLGFVTHELRSPIAGIMQDAMLLEEGYLGELSPPQRERLARMIAKGRYLLGLIQEYLDLARIEGGGLKPTFRGTDLLGEVIEPAIELVREHWEAKGMSLERRLPDAATAELDPELMKIVLVNLLSNAAKYGRERGVIRLTVESRPDRLGWSVWNQGPGFPASEQGRLFRKFSRIPTPELSSAKGTGIGLYTCWRVVHAHGGRIRADSEPGAWAEFAVEIPQPPAPPAVLEEMEA